MTPEQCITEATLHMTKGNESLDFAGDKSPGAPAGDYWHHRAQAHFLAASALVAMAAVGLAAPGQPLPPLAKGGKR
jgi:hypothetical protein